MAEIVGLVASSIAIVETASKIAGAVLTLKKLWDEIQDVPDTIRKLMTEIEVLEPILTVIEEDFESTGTPLPRDRASQLAVAYCRKAVTDLDELVQHLTVNLQAARRSKRGKTKVTVILEKEILKNLHERMQAAIRLLTLAQQTYLVALTRSQPEIIFRRLESTQVTSSCNPVELSHEDVHCTSSQKDDKISIVTTRQFEKRTSFSRFGNWRTALGNIAWGRGKEDENTIFGWMTRFEAPAWLSQRAWDLRITHSTTGWQVNLKPYCVRPSVHPVFSTAKCGDTKALGALIKSGQASVHDIDESGWSLLHYACWHSRVDLTQQLLLWGADISLNAFFDPASPVHCAVGGMIYNDHDLLIWPEMDHLLISIGAYEDVEGANPWRPGSRQGVKGDNKQNVMSKSVKSFDFFQPVFSPNHAKLDICERLDYGRVQWGYKDDVLRYLLFNGGTVTTEQIQVLERHGIGPLNLVAYGYQSNLVGGVDMRLRTLVREMVKMKADLHFEQQPNALPQHMRGVDGYPFSTPFFAVLIPDSWYPYHYECSRDLQKKIRRSMLCWLQDIQICGVNLEQFGKIEKKVFRKHKILKERWYPFNQWMQLSDFKYGPDPEDWMLEWDSVPEDYAGKFWYFVEEQLQSPELPGAWVDSLPEYGWEGVGYYDADSQSSGSGVEDDVVDQTV